VPHAAIPKSSSDPRPQGDVEGVHSGVIYRKHWLQGASRNHASTLIDPAAAAAMVPFLQNHYGNPFSGHWAATTAKALFEMALVSEANKPVHPIMGYVSKAD
jgi:hypothetical protein